MRYRIKINELNNSDLKYIPQVLKKNNENELEWHSIYNILGEKIIFEHTVKFFDYDSEIEALEIIEKHKKQIEWLNSFQIKSITYKEIL